MPTQAEVDDARRKKEEEAKAGGQADSGGVDLSKTLQQQEDMMALMISMRKEMQDARASRAALASALGAQSKLLGEMEAKGAAAEDESVLQAELAKTRRDVAAVKVKGNDLLERVNSDNEAGATSEAQLKERLRQLEQSVHPDNLKRLVQAHVGTSAAVAVPGVAAVGQSYMERVAAEAAPMTREQVWTRMRNAQIAMEGGAKALPSKLGGAKGLSDEQEKAREEEERLAAELLQKRLREKNLDAPIGELTTEEMMLVAYSLEPNRSGYHGEVEASRGIVKPRDLCTRTLKDWAYEMQRQRHNQRLNVVRLAAMGKKVVGAPQGEQGADDAETKVAVAADPKERASAKAAIAALQLGARIVVVHGHTCGPELTDREVVDSLSKVKLSRSIKRKMNESGDAFLVNVAATKVIMLAGKAEQALQELTDAQVKVQYRHDAVLDNIRELCQDAHDRAFDWGVLAGVQSGDQRHLSNLYRDELLRQDLEIWKLLKKACESLIAARVRLVPPGLSKKDARDKESVQTALAYKQCRRYIFLHLLIRASHEVAVVSTDPNHVFVTITAEGTFQSQTIDRILKTTRWDSKQL